jgi:hypothetical protein
MESGTTLAKDLRQHLRDAGYHAKANSTFKELYALVGIRVRKPQLKSISLSLIR